MMQANEGEGLTARQRRAVLALLEAPSAEAAAAAVGVASSTLWRWRQTPAFQRAFQDARAAFRKGAGPARRDRRDGRRDPRQEPVLWHPGGGGVGCPRPPGADTHRH